MGYKIDLKKKSQSHVQLFETPWTAALQAPLSMEFSRQEYWSGLPFPSPGDLPNSGIKPSSQNSKEVDKPSPQKTMIKLDKTVQKKKKKANISGL